MPRTQNLRRHSLAGACKCRIHGCVTLRVSVSLKFALGLLTSLTLVSATRSLWPAGSKSYLVKFQFPSTNLGDSNSEHLG